MKIALVEYRFYKCEENDYNLIYSDELANLIDVRVLVTNHYFKTDYKTIVLNHTNQGKDVGAKLLAIDFLMSIGQDIDVIFLVHDKKSPHSPLGNYWFQQLSKIFRPPYFDIVLNEISKPNIGICCSSQYIKSEFDRRTAAFQTANNSILNNLIATYGIMVPEPYYFVAGTIFCCKWKPIKDFFTINNPLVIKSSLELGNVQDIGEGTFTHSWERFFSWIVTSNGLSIRGI